MLEITTAVKAVSDARVSAERAPIRASIMPRSGQDLDDPDDRERNGGLTEFLRLQKPGQDERQGESGDPVDHAFSEAPRQGADDLALQSF